jgi:predicted nucleic acid-binding protein
MNTPPQLKKFVWDTSAILSIKEQNAQGYSPGHSLMKDLLDGWIPGPYQNIFPSIAAFEVDASVSRMHREGRKILREFYIVDDRSVIYPIDQELIRRSSDVVTIDGFSKLRGADLIFACIAYIEGASLVTLDDHFNGVAQCISVLNLNESRDAPKYRKALSI